MLRKLQGPQGEAGTGAGGRHVPRDQNHRGSVSDSEWVNLGSTSLTAHPEAAPASIPHDPLQPETHTDKKETSPQCGEGSPSWGIPIETPGRPLYEYPLVAVTSYSKFSGLKQHTFVVLQVCGRNVRHGSPWAKIKVSRRCVPSGGSR